MYEKNLAHSPLAEPEVLDLKSLNTLALPGIAHRYVRITQVSQLADRAFVGQPRFVLGGGSNWVLTGDVEAYVLHMSIRGRRLLKEDAEAWYVEAGAGECWHEFVQWTLAQGWPGLENLSLIPGTVGAAPIQNIGAYGVEVGERIASVRFWDFARQASCEWRAAECQFAYRDSVFKQAGWHLNGTVAITSVVFRLPKIWQANIRYGDVAAVLGEQVLTPQAVADAIMQIRRQKLPDPHVLPNAGSFFQNPVVSASLADHLAKQHPAMPSYPQVGGGVKLAAGWLIEQAGWKGRSLGPVGMFERQALVLVNHGGARSADVLNTVAAVQAAVEARFGVRLQPEPVFFPT